MRSIIAGLALAALLSSAPAMADEATPKPLSLTATFRIETPVDAAATAADISKTIARATEQLGDLATRECALLTDIYKGQCRADDLNIGVNVNERQIRRNVDDPGAQPKEVNANLSVRYTLTPLATPPSPAPTK